MSLRLEQAKRDGATVVTPTGLLEVATYREMRDFLTKVGTDDPRAVIVDLAALEIDSTSALSVFTAAHTRLGQWPGVPLMLADGSPRNRELMATGRTRRYLPVHDTVADAIDAIGEPPPRRVDRIELVNEMGSARVARGFMSEVCAEWGVTRPIVDDALLLVNELVTNVVMHTGSAPRIRVELRRGVLSIAVSDDVPGDVAVRDPGVDLRGLGGLLLVAQTAVAWGCMPTSGGGKVVWATLRIR
ncbi:STAS domain-containing protein [Amycolatopsis lurida]